MLWKKAGYKFGVRLLKLGVKGEDVGLLQRRLRDLGYEPGPVDQNFGYLTQEALEFFQRDYRLRIDGIAGKQVFELLCQEQLPITRRIHIVKPQEDLAEIAATYNITPTAFRNHKQRQIYPGQQLIFFEREVWGILPNTITAEESYARHQKCLSGIFVPVKPNQPTDNLTQGPKAKMAYININSDHVVNLHVLLTKRKARTQFLKFCSELKSKTDGLMLPWEQISRVDGARYYQLLRRLRKQLNKNRLLVLLTEQMPRWNIFGGIDFTAIGRLADQIVIKQPLCSNTHPAALEKMIHTMLNYIPAYKLLLMIPVHAVLWKQNEVLSWEKLSYSAARTMVFRYGARLGHDEQGKPFYQFFHKQQEQIIHIPSIGQFNKAVGLVNQYNLAGIVIDCLGDEDPRVWRELDSYFKIAEI